MTNMPFFTRDGETFHPTEVANGPWDPKSLHGRVIIGLLGFAIEERHSGPEFVPARLTVDMFRLPTIDKPIQVTTRLVRDGMRIRVVAIEGETTPAVDTPEDLERVRALLAPEKGRLA